MSQKLNDLTPYQENLLACFKTGKIMHRCSPSNVATVVLIDPADSFYFEIGECGWRRSAVYALLRIGLIEEFDEDLGYRWRRSKYRITKAGRER